MHLGRTTQGGNAMMIISVDMPVSDEVIAALHQIDGFESIQFVDLNK